MKKIILFFWLLATFGITLDGTEKTIKESLFFGNLKSPIEIYLFTDWGCPACRNLDSELEKIVHATEDKAKWTFVDFPIHRETFFYSPYNVSFMIFNKPKYFKLRNEMFRLAMHVTDPKDDQMILMAKEQGSEFHPLSQEDIALSQKYFKQLAEQFYITRTPTVIIINIETKKGRSLTGEEITEAKVLKAIGSLQR
jgi:protein-disulfide isomerase